MIFIKNNIFFACICFLLLTGCEKEKEESEIAGPGEYKVSGEIANLGKGKVLLQQVVNENLVTKDSAEVSEKGTFNLKAQAEGPEFYILRFNDSLAQLLILDKKEVEVKADAKSYLETFSVKGSPATNDYLTFNKKILPFVTKENQAKQAIPALLRTGNLDSLQVIQSRLESAQQGTNDFIKQYIDSIVPSLAVFNFIQYLNIDKDFDYIVDLSKRMNEKLPENKFTKVLSAEVNKIKSMQEKMSKGVGIGSVAPEISLPDPAGEIVKLSSLKGKYVLLDFWASWCGPCRSENPNVVKVYNKYKGKGFEILGVSLDKSKDAWLAAIKKDNLTWKHVSDLKFWDSSVVPLYGIEGIPATYLLDKEGKVLAVNLRGEALEAKLAEIFK